MASLKIYRSFIKIAQSQDEVQDTVYITPYSVSAYSSGNTGVVETLTPVESLTGRFSVVMDLDLYSLSEEYTLVWSVRYVEPAPVKLLTTRFKVNPNQYFNVGSEIDMEVSSDTEIELEVEMSSDIEYEIINY